MEVTEKSLNKLADWLWEIPRLPGTEMRVPARIYASEEMLKYIFQDRSVSQLVNMTYLPGIQKYALAMPDIHEGYGFPIGGVAAFSLDDGIISPGGVGYDINCGVRLLCSDKKMNQIRQHLDTLSHAVFRSIPSGLGRGGSLKLCEADVDKVLAGGARRAVELGFGRKEDLESIESGGKLEDSDPSVVSKFAKKRGKDQLGTLGSGNHFVEIDYVEKVFDEASASGMGLEEEQVVVLIHTGSRGLGHQIATDYIKKMIAAMSKYGIRLPDRELACAPFVSPEGREYFTAMNAGANYAWANRQIITSEVRDAWDEVIGDGSKVRVVYDVAHNIAKVEEYEIDGVRKKMVVHRKGATRAFPGQPVLIPGSMGTSSYVLVGQEKSLKESFGSSCHGSGRRMSRKKASKMIRGFELKEKLESEGIIIRTGSVRNLPEEAPEAYKDVEMVVDVVQDAGIAKKVVRLKPLIVVKG